MLLVVTLIIVFVVSLIANIVGSGFFQEIWFRIQDYAYNMSPFSQFLVIVAVIGVAIFLYSAWQEKTK